MSPVLVIEPAATLRYALSRVLEAAGFRAQTLTAYTEGAAALARPDADYSAVMIGLPPESDSASQALLSTLADTHPALPVVLLAHHQDPEAFSWAAQRPHAALLLWQTHREAPECLRRLLTDSPPASVQSGTDLQPVSVLFVDDNRTVRTFFARLLTREGYVVDTASNLAEAQSTALAKSYDIAIIDYFMPGGNGDELCRVLREEPRTANIVTAVLTGSYQEDIIRDCLAAGAVECMFKNEAEELFVARIAAMARSVRARQAIERERQRLQGILSSVGDGVYGVDRSGRITFTNPAARAALGYPRDESLIGRSAFELIHHTDGDGQPIGVEDSLLQRAYHSGEVLRSRETVFWTRERSSIPVEYTVFPLRIGEVHQGSVVAFRDVTERKSLEKKLLWQANHDPLTQLYNRGYFEQMLEQEVANVRRNRLPSALLYVDLDRFKYINDTAGHAAGDQLLIEVSTLLRSRLRESDLLSRLGGDEFAVILRGIGEHHVERVAESFRRVLEDFQFTFQGRSHQVLASFGVALIRADSASASEVLANADIACHVAKGKGRNLVHIYEPESDQKYAMQLELGWSARLQSALQQDGFALHYQPIIPLAQVDAAQLADTPGSLWPDLADSPCCYEVLLRLQDSDGEVVSPNAFLPTAERFGLIPQIDTWVLGQAVKQLVTLNAVTAHCTFTVNIAGPTLAAESFRATARRLLTRHRVAPGSLIIEITETCAIENIDGVRDLIEELRALGCRFALDDFGTGFSSFNHLKRLPVDFVKIDGQFVRGMAEDAADRAVVSSINEIAHAFGKQTIAEFVERRETVVLLKELGVDFVQGYYIAPPLHEVAAVPGTSPRARTAP